MTKAFLNCDLGEWESSELASAIIPLVDQVNLACGGHAGSASQIRDCKERCDLHQVAAGAHPGLPGNRGRGSGPVALETFSALLAAQISFFVTHAGRPTHLKLHGSLYHLSEADPAIRSSLLDFCEDEELPIIAFADGEVVRSAQLRGLPYFEESFLDRRRLPNGQLVPRSDPEALITEPEEVRKHLPHLRGDTYCLHSDSPNSLAIAAVAREFLGTS